MKYKKKPVIIDAMSVSQIFSTQIDNWSLLPEWVKNNIENKNIIFDRSSMNFSGFKIITLEGIMDADYNDMIIKGVKGEIYPCKPDIFKLTYEKV